MISDRQTDRVSTAIRQMQQVIERYVRSSLNGDLYEKAFDCMNELRQASVKEDEAPTFNKFLEKIKDTYADGPHSEFFRMLKKNKFSLITKNESEISSVVTPEEAEEFLNKLAAKPVPEKAKPKAKGEDDFDLLD